MKKMYSDEVLQDECSLISCKIKKLQSDNPLWSIVFCAYNEENYLLPTLESIAEIKTGLPIEIIAVNNASTDRTMEILEQSWVVVIDEKIKWISFARNAWLKGAKWEIIFQTDADTIVPPEWIDSHYKHHLNKEIWWVSWWINYEDVCSLYHLYRLWAISYHFFLKMIWKGPLCVWWANLSYKKDLVCYVWWFSPWSNNGEDILLFHNLSKVSKIKTVASKNINVLTSWRRYKKPYQVVNQIKSKVRIMGERILSDQTMPLNKSFMDIR